MKSFEPDLTDYENFQGFLNPSKDKSVLRSRNNQCLTAAIFLERTLWSMEQRIKDGTWDHSPLYTLGEWGREGCVSAYQIFIHSLDEYEAAMKIVGSMYHWESLCQKKWFTKHLVVWRKHLAMKDLSLAKKTILIDVQNGDGPSAKKIMDLSLKVLQSEEPKTKPKKSGKKDMQSPAEASFDQLMETHLGKA